MKRKIVLLTLVSVCAVTAAPLARAADQPPDLVAQARQAERMCFKRQFAEAEQIYTGLLDGAVDAEERFEIRRKLAAVLAAQDNRQAMAKAAVEGMLTDYADHVRLPHAIHEIAERCHTYGKAKKATEIYAEILSEQPSRANAIWLVMGQAIADTFAGDEDGAWANIDKLLNDYHDDSRAAESLGQVAWSCRKIWDFRNARTLYRHVVDHWPDNERAIYSQRGVILASIALKEKEAGEAATAKLFAKYSGHDDFVKVVSDVAEEHRGVRNFEKARELHTYIIDNHPDYSGAIYSQRGVILCSIALEDDLNAQAGIDRLLAQHGGHPKIADVSYQVARRLAYKDPPRAKQLYELVIRERPESDIGLFSRMNLGGLKVYAGHFEGGQAVFDEVLTANEEHALLPKLVALVAEAYYDKGAERRRQKQSDEAHMCYRKALVAFYWIMDDLPETEYTTAWAHYHAGMCHRLLVGEDAQALICYEKLVKNWPDFERAWDAQYRIGQIYNDLGNSGKIPRAIAEAKTRAAFEAVLRDYPDCMFGSAAQKWLRDYAVRVEERARRKAEWEQIIEKFPESELAEEGRQWLRENGFLDEGEGQ